MNHGMDGGSFMGFGWIFWLIILVVVIGAVFTLVNKKRNR